MKFGKMALAAAFGFAAVGVVESLQAARVNDIINSLAGGGEALIKFEDDDASSIVDANDNGKLDARDILKGVIRIQKIVRAFPPGGSVDIPQGTLHSEMTGLYQLRVKSVTQQSSGSYYYLFEPDPGFANDLASILGGSPGLYYNAMAAFWDDTTPNFTFNDTEPIVRASAYDGDLWGVFGFVNVGDYFNTTTISDDIALAIAAPIEGVGYPSFGSGGFSLSQIPGTGGLFNNLDVLPNAFGGHLAGSYTLYGKDSDPVTSGIQHVYPAFDVTSDADFTIRVIPLPAAAWMGMGLLGAIGVFRGIRRNRQ